MILNFDIKLGQSHSSTFETSVKSTVYKIVRLQQSPGISLYLVSLDSIGKEIERAEVFEYSETLNFDVPPTHLRAEMPSSGIALPKLKMNSDVDLFLSIESK